MTLSEFINMGGYGGFVWSAYAIWLIVMVLNYLQPRFREQNTIKRLLKRHKIN